jgi:hypothetical protein
VGSPGAWSAVLAGPEPVVGARWIAVGDDLYRIGGAGVRGSAIDLDGPAWRLHAGTWQPLPLPPGLSSRVHASVVLEPSGAGLRMWGGLAGVSQLDALLAQDVAPGAPGGLRLDLVSGTWSALTAAQLAVLPATRADAAVAMVQPGVAWVFGGGPLPSSDELWRIDLAKASKQLVWQSADSLGPPFRPGSSLVLDAAANRLLVLQVQSGLKVWTLSLDGTPGWQVNAVEPMAGAARTVVLGEGLAERLVVTTTAPGGPAATARLLQLAQPPAFVPWSGPVPAWWGPVASGWLAAQERGFVDGALDQAGALRGGFEAVLRDCVGP